MKKLSLVSPVRNEAVFLREIVDRVFEALKGIDFEWILVDDASTDKSLEILRELEKTHKNVIKVLTKPWSGKSQTVKLGIAETTGEYVVIQDADLEYDPKDLVIMLNKIENEKLDVVYGNRFGKGNEVVYFQNWIGNTLLSGISAFITGVRSNMWPRDMEVCYKMAKGELFRKLGATIEAKTNFGFEPEITAKFSKVKGVKFAQIPIHYYPRTVAEGKKMQAFKHGYEALKEIFKYNFVTK